MSTPTIPQLPPELYERVVQCLRANLPACVEAHDAYMALAIAASKAGDVRRTYEVSVDFLRPFDGALAKDLGTWLEGTPMPTLSPDELCALEVSFLNGDVGTYTARSYLEGMVKAATVAKMRRSLARHKTLAGLLRHIARRATTPRDKSMTDAMIAWVELDPARADTMLERILAAEPDA